jgi:hypothetical protein
MIVRRYGEQERGKTYAFMAERLDSDMSREYKVRHFV